MVITFIRSSNVGTYNVCQHKFLLEYILGLPSDTNEKASQGNVFHKAFELLSLKKISKDNLVDCEDIGLIEKEKMTENWAITTAFRYYRELEQPHWDDSVFKTIEKWFYKALKQPANPINKNIIGVEKRFNIVIKKEKFSYLFRGDLVEGYIGLKGTIDCIIRDSDGHIHLVDYKTGKRSNINTGKEKSWSDLNDDFQINLYLYAAHKIYPNEDIIYFTIWFINNGGPFTFGISKKDVPKIENKIICKFREIERNKKPRLRKYDWFCKYVCSFAKNNHEDTGLTQCEFFKREVEKHGVDYVTDKYSDGKKPFTYGDGGGKKSKEV